ncbi:fibrinogen alpha chain-like [Dromiciops gliroides]|uniref:fibrinogen alpha chain-like n=1 Tax=Dromiciops gliroides TaxID=33562 RepID=UPI001CC7F582|nr:fibrinogen alpha chain-like [Dromiciops gliroides]
MLPGRIFCLVLCVVGTTWATKDEGSFIAEGGGVRGPRVVERVSSSCKESDWPFCSDEDWTYKCPSGCRMKGLIDETNEDFTNRITKIRNLLFDSQKSNKDSSSVTRNIMEVLRVNAANDYNNDNAFGQVTEDLRRRIETLKRQVMEQVQKIISLQNSIRNQQIEMKRLEVDIDIKIRSCQGSCSRSLARELNTKNYEEEQKQLERVAAVDLYPNREIQYLPSLKIHPASDLIPVKYKNMLQEASSEWKSLIEMKQMVITLENPNSNNYPGGSSPSGTGLEPGSTRPITSRPESFGTGNSGTQNLGSTGSRHLENSGTEPFRPDRSGHGGSSSAKTDRGNMDWSRHEETASGGSLSKGGGLQISKQISEGDKAFVLSREKDTSGTTTTTKHRACSKMFRKTTMDPDGREEVTKEVVNSEDGADCGDMPDFDFGHPDGSSFSFTGIGSLDEFRRLHPDRADFFGIGSTGTRSQSASHRGDSSFASATSHGSSTKVTGLHRGDGDTDDWSLFNFGEPEFSTQSESSSRKTVVSSSKTLSQGSKSMKMADEADGDAQREKISFIQVRSSKRSHGRTRTARGIHKFF